MSLDAPGGLWLLGAIPVVVLLWLLKPRRPRVRIPSVLLWPASLAERQAARPWQRLRNHPLLWLQLLVAALLALAVAQPFVPSEVSERQVIVLLDASGSMHARDVQPSRWDAARAAVVDVARGLRVDQTVSVIRLDEEPRVLAVGLREASQIEAVLRDEQPSLGGIDSAAAVALASGIVRGEESEWVLVGDGDFPALPQGTAAPPGTRARFLQIGSASAGNVALSGLAIRATGTSYSLQVGMQNTGDAPASGSVQLLAEGDRVLTSSEWHAEPRDRAYVTWSGIERGPRWFEARLSDVSPASANALSTDDRAWTIAGTGDSGTARALLVSAGNTFLERVVAVNGALRAEKVTPADWPALIGQGDAAYALVIFDRQPLDGLATGPGSALYVGGASGEAFQPRVIAPRTDHVLLRGVDWSEVRIGRARRLADDSANSGWETVVDSDGGPLLSVRTVRTDASGDRPARLRREALLSFDLSDSDLPLRPAFPVLMANLLDWLVPSRDTVGQSVAPGSSLAVSGGPLAQSLRAESMLEPNAGQDLAPPWPARPFRPTTPGVYRVLQDQEASGYVVADAYAPTEADISPREPTALTADLQDDGNVRGVLRSVRGGLWLWLLAALLLLSLLEWGVDARGR